MAIQDQTAGIIATGITASAYPIFGEYGPIIVGAVLGALLALGSKSQMNRWEAAKFILKWIAVASIFSSSAATWAAGQLGGSIPTEELLAPVACLIAWVGNDWYKIKEWFVRSKTQ